MDEEQLALLGLMKWIIGGMAAGYVVLAGYIVKLWRERDEERKERLKRAEEKLALLELLKQERGGNAPTGGDE
jgi:uncharacterized membrane protein